MALSILVVEDDAELLKRYLRALQRRVKPAALAVQSGTGSDQPAVVVEGYDTVQEALERLRAQPFDVLVVDLVIPGISGEERGGLQLVAESKKLDALRSIIVVTGYGTVALARDMLMGGAFDFIEKSDTAIEELVDAVQRAVAHRETNLVRFGNPFSRMTDEEPTVFGGRGKELEFFQERLARALDTRFREHFVVLGNWGIGKSTLLREYKKLCQAQGYVAALVRLQPLDADTRLIDAARSIVEGILRDIPYPGVRLKRTGDFLKSVGISIVGTGFQVERRDPEAELGPVAFLHDSLVELWADLKDKTGLLTVLLDDLDNFAARPEVLTVLKQTLSMDKVRQARILVGLSCPSTNWSQFTSPGKHHPIARYFTNRIDLGPLSEEEVRDTILRSREGTGIAFSRDVVDRVYELTQGHPFEMQVLCYHLFSNQLGGRVDREVWDKALDKAIKDLGLAVFDNLYGLASREEAKVLRAVATHNSPVPTREIQRSVQAGRRAETAKSISKYIQRLRDKGLVQRCGRGSYLVPDPMFRAYLCMIADEK